MNKVRFGIVGCGAIHGTHARALAEIDCAELAGVYDILPERSAEASTTYSVPAYSSLQEMFAKVDAVTVCTPSGLHAQIGIEAAQAGRHVLSEKPIDVNPSKAERLIETCRREGVKLGVISQHRFAEDVIRVRELVQRGELGKILNCDVYNKWYRTQGYYDSGEWRGTRQLDGGCMMNQGIHYIDLAQWIMGGVESVQAFTGTLSHDMECEDSAYAFVRYRNGAVGLLQVQTTCFPGFAERVEIHGTTGSVIFEGDKIKFLEIDLEAAKLGFYGKGIVAHPVPPAELAESELTSAGANPLNLWDVLHREQIEDFARAILEDRVPMVSGEDAIEPVREINACYASAASGGRSVAVQG